VIKQDAVKPLMFVAIPTRGRHSHFFSQDLAGAIYPSNFSMMQGYFPYLEVGRARNLAVAKAKEMGAKYLVFRDEDVIAGASAVKTLLWHMANHPEWTFCGGLYATKSIPPEPLLYTEWGMGSDYDWKAGELKRVKFTGMGICMIRVSDFDLLDTAREYEDRDQTTGAITVVKEYFKTEDEGLVVKGITTKYGQTEDAHFFAQLEEKGLQAWVDTSLLCQHYDDKQIAFYGVPTKGKPDAWNNTPRTLNLGSGGEYDPYEISVDLRDDPRVTYKRDIRNLPEDWADQFDIVKANHVLEHFGFGQTQEIVNEWARVVKPGGTMRLTVPDLEAFVERILNGPDGKSGHVDIGILGGLYGDQGHSLWRQEAYGGEHDGRFIPDSFENNHHKTGFTSRSLAGYMAAAGLEIIELKRDSFQILAVGKKPEGETNDEKGTENGAGDGGSSGDGIIQLDYANDTADTAAVQVFSEPVAPVDNVIDA
jgi:SAM-dependent methyltransferase